jgi:hypothetical protein
MTTATYAAQTSASLAAVGGTPKKMSTVTAAKRVGERVGELAAAKLKYLVESVTATKSTSRSADSFIIILWEEEDGK